MDKFDCGCNNNARENDLLCTLRQIDFAIIEVTLYLDVYPECREAKEYLKDMREKRAKVAAEYEAKHGMLTMYGVCGKSSDRCASWPWEYAAN